MGLFQRERRLELVVVGRVFIQNKDYSLRYSSVVVKNMILKAELLVF